MATQTVYTDDADAFCTWTITDAAGQTLDWATPQIAVGDAAYTAATWLGVAGPIRDIRLSTPLGLGLTPGRYFAVLKVPAGSDFLLGSITILDRT
jgi:hypothetical protein